MNFSPCLKTEFHIIYAYIIAQKRAKNKEFSLQLFYFSFYKLYYFSNERTGII